MYRPSKPQTTWRTTNCQGYERLLKTQIWRYLTFLQKRWTISKISLYSRYLSKAGHLAQRISYAISDFLFSPRSQKAGIQFLWEGGVLYQMLEGLTFLLFLGPSLQDPSSLYNFTIVVWFLQPLSTGVSILFFLFLKHLNLQLWNEDRMSVVQRDPSPTPM